MQMKSFIRIMKALSDPSRVKIIKMLGRKELCVCEITALLGLAQPTASKHLRILEEAGLLDFRKDGAWIIYRLSRQNSSVGATMLAHLDSWLEDDSQIQEMLTRLPGIDQCRVKAA